MPEVSASNLISSLISSEMTSTSSVVVYRLQDLLLHLLVTDPLPFARHTSLVFVLAMDVEEDTIFYINLVGELSNGSFARIGTSLGVSVCCVT